ncbi:stalk domain-containing protein [Peptoniphilus sp. DNF00840]|uniref:stalk domain-containing protein n=1 Tax=Peptoniphilus sp. DNF00840 TaxID=1477000 RepID=UPI0007842488|nr:stalk domain-containing protein [Peptoniphilus sp. DNF00840]KXB70813.1 copper amine oxidase domain protein [Peptoniphilus sp. DNF00840]
MNRKMFLLVTSLAILSSSLSPTWAAGKNFIYNNLEKTLALQAQASDVKNSEKKEELPLVIENMPDDRVKDKYVKIIFVPETRKVNGVQHYGKLLDKEGNEVSLSDISYNGKVIKGKEYYVLKGARWRSILYYKINNKQVLYVRKADNNESDPEIKSEHEFLGWTSAYGITNIFADDYSLPLSGYSIDMPYIIKAGFQNKPCFYDNDFLPERDSDGYEILQKKDNYTRIGFIATAEKENWKGSLSLKDSQKKFSLKEIQNSKKIYFYIRKDSGTYKFVDFKPEVIDSEGKTFWYWALSSSLPKEDFEMGSKDLDFFAEFIGEYAPMKNYLNLEEKPMPRGCYKVEFQPEDGYKFNDSHYYIKFAIRRGVGLKTIRYIELLLKDSHLKGYEGKVAWYDGYKKIDNILEQVIDSDKVFTLRRVRDFESEKFNPLVNEVQVNKGDDPTIEKLKGGITNLPNNLVKVEIKTKADTSQVGTSKAVLKLTFTDTSSKEVEVTVKIIDKIPGKIITPIPKIKAEDIIKEEIPYNGKINLLDNIKNLPDGAKVEDVSKIIDTKIPGTYTGKVKVTFKEGSSRIVEISVEVLHPLAEKYKVQKPDKTPVEKLDSLSLSEKSEIVEKVKTVNPQADTVEVSDKGETTLVYADGSKNIISPEDTIVLKKNESDNKDPEEKPGKKDDKKDPEQEPGKEENNKDHEENKEEDNHEVDKKNEENKSDSWNYFPRYYVRDHKTPTNKQDVKIDSKESHAKAKVKPRKFVIDMKSGTYTLTEDGKTLEKSLDVKPIIENNRTMLPLRALAEILDAKVIWNEATRTASFTRDGLTALIQIDDNKIVLSNGKTIDLDAKPLNVNGRIYLPLVYVGQVFGLTSGKTADGKEDDIEWKEESKAVTINIK